MHTVCQHVFWERLLPLWQALGVTDLHQSHCEPKPAAAAGAFGMRVHSWPLAAANVVNEDRREGLEMGRPVAARSLLATFVGAHMAHYRSQVRLRLREDAVIKVRRDDVAGLFERLRRMRVEEPARLAAMQAAGRAVYERF